jgi:Domain of Unknown Function (DUF1080)
VAPSLLLAPNPHARRCGILIAIMRKISGRIFSRHYGKLCLLVAVAAFAQTANHDFGYTDTPMLPGLPYHVHDPARPIPPVVTPATEPGGAPSDATVLFDGRDLSKWDPPAWKVENGYMEVVPGKGDIATKEKFGDAQLHVEWATPAIVRGTSQGRGNSGVFLQGRYEIQVLDSYQNRTYADGQAGAIYGQWPPLVNASRKPGEWQTYDIFFEAPRFEGEKLVKPAFITVIHNGVLVQLHKEAMGPTVNRQLAKYVPQPAEDSLKLQNHGNPVRYRNIWIRRISLQ